jgi:hypothetical protein
VLTIPPWNEKRKLLSSFLVFLHFADFQETLTRQFDVYINEDDSGPRSSSYSPSYMAASYLYTNDSYTSTDGTYNITLTATAGSQLPPMINAFEIYNAITVDGPTTFPQDCKSIDLAGLWMHALSSFLLQFPPLCFSEAPDVPSSKRYIHSQIKM